MEQRNSAPPIPEDATQATEEQRREQHQLDHKDDDPNAPARHQDHHQIPGEN